MAEAEAIVHYQMPPDLRTFILVTGGGEGDIGVGYAAIYGPDDLRSSHLTLHADEYFPDLVVIGSDGLGNAFGIVRSGGRYVNTPFIGDEPAVRTDLGGDFAAFIQNVATYYPTSDARRESPT